MKITALSVIYGIAASAFGAWIGLLLGPCNGIFITLIAFACLDYLTGVTSAIINRKLSSAIGFRGIARKVLMFVIVAVANLIDVHVLGDGYAVLRTATIFFYLANEGLSILENAGECGLPIPKKILNVLQQLRNKGEDPDDEE